MSEARGNKETGVRIALTSLLTNPSGSPFRLDVDVELPGQGITVVFGPSGCGKTTLLRCVAGLQPVERGLIAVNGETWLDADRRLPVHKRSLGYVFQEASLFPHLNVRGNLEFARRRARAPLPDRRLDELVDLMGIASLLHRSVTGLSGGERQRVAVVRALAANPRLLLMDEPLAALDTTRKQEILPYLESLHRELRIPLIYVTHSVDEVARLADHLLIMEAGRITAGGSPERLFADPRLSAGFGSEAGAVLTATVAATDPRWQLARLRFGDAELWVRDNGAEPGAEMRLRILARDVSLSLQADQPSSILNRLPARIESLTLDEDEAMVLVGLRVGETPLLASISRRSAHELKLQEGSEVWAQIKSVAILR